MKEILKKIFLITVLFSCTAFTGCFLQGSTNEETHGSITEETPDDLLPPVAGTPIKAVSVTHNSITLSWGAASDDATPVSKLEYRLVYLLENKASLVDNPCFYTEVFDYTRGKLSHTLTDLPGCKRFYFFVQVRDSAEYKTLYDSIEVNTLTPPVIDTSFGQNGKTFLDLGSGNNGSPVMAIQADGKIVTASMYGYDMNGGSIAVARFNTDGSIDTGFGTYGVTVTKVGTYSEEPVDIAIQADSKIVVAVDARKNNDEDIALVRYNSNGTLDTTFDGDGRKLHDLNFSEDQTRAVEIQPDGKIVVTGYSNDGNIVVVRLNSDGSEDNTFGTNGRVDVVPSGYTIASGNIHHTKLLNGQILIAGSGYGEGYATLYDIFIVCLNADGSPDTTFGTSGQLLMKISDKDDYLPDMCITAEGKILLECSSNYKTLFIRLNADGTYDSTFGTQGLKYISTEANPGRFLILDTGKIMLFTLENQSGSDNDLLVIRLNADFSIDTDFGDGGRSLFAGGCGSDFYGGLVQGIDGGVILAGEYLCETVYSENTIIIKIK